MVTFSRLALLGTVLALPLGLWGCPGGTEESCGQSLEVPSTDEVPSGRGRATRSDGESFDEVGSWAPAPSSSLVLGNLSMVIQFDEAGLVVDDLIADGAFPICVPQGERSERSGQANLVQGGFVTNADHTGGLAILAREGNDLVGRFSFTLAGPNGETLDFDDGIFRVPQR